MNLQLKKNEIKPTSRHDEKRSLVVNVLLSFILGLTIVMSLAVLAFGVCMMWIDFTGSGWRYGIPCIFFSLMCISYMWIFLAGNRRSAILPAFVGSVAVWYVMVMFFDTLTDISTTFLDDQSHYDYVISILRPLAISVILNFILFGMIRLIMMIRKDGVSA